MCPYMGQTCDGGGNRDMARVSASDDSIRPFFEQSVARSTGGYFPCGICSVRLPSEDTVWAICPRRLLSFTKSGLTDKHNDLASRIFSIAGYRAGEKISVWSEVTLRESASGGEEFNYRLDYVLQSTESNSPPVIVEVMTCSTSGGNRRDGSDIQGAFRRAVISTQAPNVQSNNISAPGVNVRQVWSRMASQMIAKSEAANSWGGRTIWVVQDLLVDYIRRKTALSLDKLYSPNWTPGEVNMLVSDLNGPVKLYAGPIRPEGNRSVCWMELLGAPHIPTLKSINEKLRAKKPITTLRVPS